MNHPKLSYEELIPRTWKEFKTDFMRWLMPKTCAKDLLKKLEKDRDRSEKVLRKN